MVGLAGGTPHACVHRARRITARASSGLPDQDLPALPGQDPAPEHPVLLARVPAVQVAGILPGQALGEDLQVGKGAVLGDPGELDPVLQLQQQVEQLQAQGQDRER